MNVFTIAARRASVIPRRLVASPTSLRLRGSPAVARLSSRAYSTATPETPASEPSSSQSSSSSSTEAPAADTEEQKALAAKDAEILDLTSRLRYMTADFQNLQRISEREKQIAKDFAISKFASDLLATVDVLALALKSVPQEARTDSASNPKLVELYTGVEITEKQLLQTLAKHGVKPYDPTGEQFDPNRHEALYSAPIPGKEPGTIIDVQKLGFLLKDRTLRAPQVGVVADTSS